MPASVWVTWPALTKYGTIGVVAGLLTLAAERENLFSNNLFDTENWERYNGDIACDDRSLAARTEDGTCNILDNPAEGSVLMRFGRNVDPEVTYGETENDTLLSPNPREVSNVLMARDEFKPATTLNFIAAAWIQFMIHDWFDHGPRAEGNPINVPLPANDPLGSGTMQVKRTQPDPTRTADEAARPKAYRNLNTHWWDGSQLYGSSSETNALVRTFEGGRLKINADDTLPVDPDTNVPVAGFSENWWLGLSMMHQIFTKEHNAIADMLAQNHPGRSDQWIYDRARLINAALMAKIHTVEWTPAIIANPVTESAMHANWYGILGDNVGRGTSFYYHDSIRRLANTLKASDSVALRWLGIDPMLSDALDRTGFIDHALAGIVGSRQPANYGVPFTLTEEFVAVYRMHPLVRDNVEVYDIGAGAPSKQIPVQNTTFGNAENVLRSEGASRLWYSFGITHPGALTLRNYPEFMRNIPVPRDGTIDLATIDILRDRERGVPRYNEFRRQIHLKPITQFEDLTTDPELLAELKRLYNNDVEQIDALVGQLAETVRPEGFGFGETAFQIFIMNASRRLMTDRFYTTDYRPEVYTQEGIDWVENNSMVDVLRRHHPELVDSLDGVENAFKPWKMNIPESYETWAACDKQDLLWNAGALRTQYRYGMPELSKVDVLGLASAGLWKKVRDRTDVAPENYKKPIHGHGVMATAKFVPTGGGNYTGLFEGSECGLLRLSVTGDPNDRGFAPGLAWKAFVDGQPSENVSALYTLSGQGDNRDFFANEMSQYVSPETNETLAINALFSLVTSRPTHLRVDDMAKVRQNGSRVASAKAPSQIFFVPSGDVRGRFSGDSRDFREDLATLEAGTRVYEVYATSTPIRTSLLPWVTKRYAKERRESARKIGELVLTSPFVASHFGDKGVFFKHQRYED